MVKEEADQLKSTYDSAKTALRLKHGALHVPTRQEVLAFMSNQADIRVSRLDPDEVNDLLDFFSETDRKKVKSGGTLTAKEQEMNELEAEFRFEAIILAGILKRIGKQQVKSSKEKKLQKSEDKRADQKADAQLRRRQRQLTAERKRPSKKAKQKTKK